MEDRFALLIDADNVSAKYIKPILDELSKYGNVTYKRIYGDWTKTNNASWKEELLQNSITPIQQFSYTHGKNATDSAMIIDAMDMLYTSELEAGEPSERKRKDCDRYGRGKDSVAVQKSV